MTKAVGAFLIFLSILLGALSAHAFRLEDAELKIFDKALLYQFMHGVALLSLTTHPRLAVSIIFGVVLFCGGLYARAMIGPGNISALAPIGGGLLMVSWLGLAASILYKGSRSYEQ